MAKFRNAHKGDEAFDTMTAEEIRRIRGAAEVMVTPGLEGLADHSEHFVKNHVTIVDERTYVAPKSMKGRRA